MTELTKLSNAIRRVLGWVEMLTRSRTLRLLRRLEPAFVVFTVISVVIATVTQHSERGFPSNAGKPALLANFRNGLRTVGQHLEGLFLHYAVTLSETVATILASIAGCRQRQRPNRSYPRVSRKPASKWRSRKSTPAPTPA